MSKIIWFAVFGILIILSLVAFNYYGIVDLSTERETIVSKFVYSGPVPEGYDEQHFRLTGETKIIDGT